MALRLGELSTILTADDGPFQRGLRAARRKFDEHSQQLKTGAAAAGAAIGVALAAGLVHAMELDKARAKLAAQVGDPALAQQLGTIAGHVYGRGFGESAADAMAGVQAIVASGLAPKGDAKTIEDLTVKAQAYATAWGTDVAEAAEYASTIIGSGLAKNATEAFDLITVASRRVPPALRQDVMEAGTEYAQFFRSLGFDGSQAFALLAEGAKKGQYGIDKTGDSVKEFTLKATDMSAATVAAYKSIGLDAGKMSNALLKGGDTAQSAFQKIVAGLLSIKDPTTQANAAVAFFGTPIEDLNKADIPEFLASMQKASGGLGDVSGAAKKAGDALEGSASQKLESFKRKVHEALVEKVGQALPYLEKVGQWAMDNSGTLLTVAGVIGGLAVTVWAVRGAMAAWNAVTLVWTGITKAAAAAQWLLNIAMSANPIGLIILAIGALVGGFILLWNNSEAFRNFWIGLWEVLKGAALAVADWFSGTLWPWMKDVWDKIAGAAGAAKDWIVGKWDALVGFVTGLPGRISSAASGMWNGLKNSFKGALNWIIGKWNNFSLTLGGGSVLGVGIPSVTLRTPNIPLLAGGGHILRAGAAVVGDAGPELLHLPAGATVRPLSGGGDATAAGAGVIGVLRLIVATPDGRQIKDELIDAASLRGQTVSRYLGISTT